MTTTAARFPVSSDAIKTFLEYSWSENSEGELRLALHMAAPHLIRAFIDTLSDRELMELRFATNNRWCDQMRAQLKKFTEVPA